MINYVVFPDCDNYNLNLECSYVSDDMKHESSLGLCIRMHACMYWCKKCTATHKFLCLHLRIYLVSLYGRFIG